MRQIHLSILALLDTPSSGRYGESLMRLFGELHADGATVCIATHDPRWITQAQRHIYLFDGKLTDQPTDS